MVVIMAVSSSPGTGWWGCRAALASVEVAHAAEKREIEVHRSRR
jgi:hypothetical protein